MNGDVDAGSPRPRPLSGGFWTLLSWLRREEQSSSNESLSSAGSDRTAVSFAFLTPAHYHSKASPIILPPPGPPTDTYKNRVRERNLRRQYDRDLTLHRKYGLFRGDGVANYDAFSLPPARRCSGAGADRLERERRATSECYQRRTAHVPGKRRAPLPPTLLRGVSLEPTVTVTRRHSRKRPAPQPPTKIIKATKENINNSCPDNHNSIQMNNKSVNNEEEVKYHEVFFETECKPEKCTKKGPKDSKSRPEKSFLKQIFEHKKRNSSVDISTVKVLPSISELDKQATEIIENKRKNTEEKTQNSPSERPFNADVLPSSSKHANHQNTTSMCIQTENVLRKPLVPNNKIEIEEKQKLKNMLKEMKDSLPKRPKQEGKVDNNQLEMKVYPIQTTKNITDTPTLRIGSSAAHPVSESTSPPIKHGKAVQIIEMKIAVDNTQKPVNVIQDKGLSSVQNTTTRVDQTIKQTEAATNENNQLHTPLKISSLLNPIYVPKNTELHQQTILKTVIPEISKENKNSTPPPIYVKTADTVRDIILNSNVPKTTHTTSEQIKSLNELPNKSHIRADEPVSKVPAKNHSELQKKSSYSTSSPIKNATNITKLNEHSRRRELVNQLEQSIAKGDERAAAEAASKLAQLRLSCSVLSFSSQILGEPSTSSAKPTEKSVPLVRNDLKVEKPIADKVPNKLSEPLPDLVKREPVSSKLTKSTQASGGKALVATNSAGTSVTQIKHDNKLSLAQASTSKETATRQVVDDVASLKIWIEDKEKARGPIQLHVRRDANVGELRRQAEQSLGLPAHLQRWIVGRTLCNDDKTSLISLAGPTLNAHFYLCLVESDSKNADVIQKETKKESEKVKIIQNNKQPTSDVYSELVNLERQALVPNAETFECDICMEECAAGQGVVLRECVHSFCKGCLSDVIRHCEEPTVSCPATNCPGELHEREIRALVSADDYQRWLARGLAAAESGTRNAFHCRTKDCTGWALCEIEVRRFPCPVCKHTNCVPCQAIHENETCEQYQAKLRQTSASSTAEKADEGTQALIDGLISRGEALQCPECSAIITKKWGCDWVKCSACKTEICWITRGRRWGPAGRGDSSGGCRCGVDGKRCHPTCGYCH